ncbi:MAG: hypothetical protein K2L38_07650, partial [Dysosmobacter sp.]|nr:hypothetical protein [Dysosmobacter sp.]
YHTYCILFFIPYFVSCHTADPTATKRETMTWIILAFSTMLVISFLMVASQLRNIDTAMHAQIPTLAIAMEHSSILAGIFTLSVMVAIYTTTAPLALIFAEYLAEPGTVKFKIIGCATVVLAFICSFVGSYAKIINFLMAFAGRVGVGVYIFAVIYRVYKTVTGRKNPEKSTEP